MLKNFFNKNNELVCVDIGYSNIKIIHLLNVEDRYEILDTFDIENEFDDKDSYIELAGFIKTLLLDNDIHTKKIIITSSIDDIIEDIVKNDVKDEKEKVLAIETEYVKNFNNIKDFENFRFDYEYLGDIKEKGRNKSYYIIAGVRNDISEKILDSFKKKGFYVDRITTQLSSISNLMKVNKKDFDGVLLSIGSKISTVVAIKNNIPVFNRRIDFGYSYVIKDLIEAFNCPKEIIIKNIKDNGILIENLPKLLDEATYSEVLNSILLSFLNELYDTLNYIRTNVDIEFSDLLISGGFSQAKGMDQLLTDYIKLKVTDLIDLVDMEIINVEESEITSSMLISLGLGILEDKK